MISKTKKEINIKWLSDNIAFKEAWESDIGKIILGNLVESGNKFRKAIAKADPSSKGLHADIVGYHHIINLIEGIADKINKFDKEETKREKGE